MPGNAGAQGNAANDARRGNTVDDMTSRDMNTGAGGRARAQAADENFAAEIQRCDILPQAEKSACHAEANRRRGQM